MLAVLGGLVEWYRQGMGSFTRVESAAAAADQILATADPAQKDRLFEQHEKLVQAAGDDQADLETIRNVAGQRIRFRARFVGLHWEPTGRAARVIAGICRGRSPRRRTPLRQPWERPRRASPPIPGPCENAPGD